MRASKIQQRAADIQKRATKIRMRAAKVQKRAAKVQMRGLPLIMAAGKAILTPHTHFVTLCGKLMQKTSDSASLDDFKFG
jgi:hypothetical protein